MASGENSIKEFVRIANEWNRADAGSLLNLLRALRPLSDAAFNDAKPSEKRCQNARVVCTNKRENFIEIA